MVLASLVVSSCLASHCSVLSFAVDEELSDIDKYHWLNIAIHRVSRRGPDEGSDYFRRSVCEHPRS